MLHVVPRHKLALSIALLASGLAFTPYATAATSPVAYIYVQTTKGVEVFSASSTGALTKVSGSPFTDSGQMGAINGSYLVSVGTDDLHAYPIESDGAIGKQASEIDTQSYGGASCGTNLGGALFDHTGKYLYVLLAPSGTSDNPCSALQSYKIASNGELTFLGDSVNDNGYHNLDLSAGINTISGSDTLAYGIQDDIYTNVLTQFTRESSGALLQNNSFKETDPTPDPSVEDSNYYPFAVAADPTDHLAVAMTESFAQNPPPPQLASYTISSNGNIASTNTWQNMPTPAFYPAVLNMSPSGKQLAVAGAGIEIYNFNGASPLTLAASLPESARDFGYLAWDNSNHLYAVDYETGNLYVYSIGAGSITAAPGSPYAISDNTTPTNQYDLIVVPK